ncbi:MAG: glycosyl transferase family 1 [Bellilinea sp.]|nr:MAG: glycosyl transferase family 1 [Bellilinea sp.]
MRIVLIGPVYPYRGGIAHYTTRLAQAIRESDHELLVLSFRRQYPRFLYPGKSDRDPSQDVERIEAEFLLDPLYPWTWQRAVNRIKEYAPGLVVIQWWTTFWAPAFWWLARELKSVCKVVFLIHNVLPHETRFFDPWLARWTLSQGGGFIVQAESQRKKLKELLPRAEPLLVEHPLYDQFADKRMDKSEARRRLGLPEDRPVLLFFGIVRPYKGLRNLIEALALVYQEGYSPLLVVAGEFWENVEDYQKRIKDLGLEDAVRIYNYYIPNEEVPVFFSAADVFVAPYTGGTQSGALKIAMAFGLPVVASEGIGGLYKVVTLQKTNINPQIIKQMARLIIDLVHKPEDQFCNFNKFELKWSELINQIVSSVTEKV